MSAPASRASPIRATSVAKGMDRPRIAAASQASTNCSKRSPTLLTRAMPISKNGQATTIPIRSTYPRSNTPSVASQTAATPLGHASPGKSRSARPRDPPRPSPDGYKTTNHRLKFEKIRDGEEGRIVPYRLKPVDCGVDEDGDPVSTCIIQWEPHRPPPRRRAPQRLKTNVTLDRAISEVRLPADPDALKAAFYKHHGGTNHAANMAWHRAVEAEELVLINGKLDHLP